MDNKDIFASNLQKYMKRNDKSRSDIAEALGISYYTVTDWVKGKKYPRMDKVERLAKYFGIMKSDLIENKIVEESENPVELGALHAEMFMDADFNDLYEDYRHLDARERQIVKDLAHSLRKTKSEA